MNDPVAPWTLSGESMVVLLRARGALEPLPAGLRRVPGPVLVAGACYTGSPVGPYLELLVGEPARLGARVGWCITTMVVDSPESRIDGRANWGYPKQLGGLLWRAEGDERELRWPERGIVLRGRPTGPPLPALVPLRTLQRRNDGPVLVPGWLRGLARISRIELETGADDLLAPVAGRHRGLQVAGMRCTIRPARHPVGIASTLRAPLRAPEPALSSGVPGRLAQR